MDSETKSIALTPEEEALLAKHLPFYRSLASQERKPTTPAQTHFVSVTLGKVAAETPHEIAYMKYRRLQKHAPNNESSTVRDHDLEGPTDGWFTRDDWKKSRGRQRWDGK